MWYSHVLKVYILAVPTYGSAWIFLEFLNVHSVLFLTIAYIGASTIFFVGAYFMIADELRETIFRYMRDIKNNLFPRATANASGRNSKL
jgi:hypothetical protein